MDTHRDNELFQLIRARVAEGERSGKYSPALDEQLLSTFDQILREERDHERINDKEILDLVEEVKKVLWSLNTNVSSASRVPGGQWIHSLVSRFIRRHTSHVITQLQELFVVQQQQIEAIISRTLTRDFLELRRADALSQHVLDRLALLEYLTVEVERLRNVKPD